MNFFDKRVGNWQVTFDDFKKLCSLRNTTVGFEACIYSVNLCTYVTICLNFDFNSEPSRKY